MCISYFEDWTKWCYYKYLGLSDFMKGSHWFTTQTSTFFFKFSNSYSFLSLEFAFVFYILLTSLFYCCSAHVFYAIKYFYFVSWKKKQCLSWTATSKNAAINGNKLWEFRLFVLRYLPYFSFPLLKMSVKTKREIILRHALLFSLYFINVITWDDILN